MEEYLAAHSRRVDAALDGLLPPAETPPESIHRAMRYSVFAGGKRVRPILCLAAAECAGGGAECAIEAACALEMVHTYSLIHDDLPALDNDDYRRGRLTNHKVFGEAMAILAGDALLTLAFQVLSQIRTLSVGNRIRLVEELSVAAGTAGGMIGGQVFDLEGEKQQPTAALLEQIHRAKTGALLRASLRMGAICAGASPSELDALSLYGEHVGLAFQIVDDILDIEQTSEQLGKTAGKDRQQNKITFPAVFGLEASHRMAEEQRHLAHQALGIFGAKGRRLAELADFIVQRKK